jgi:hypothetical protein
MAVPSLTWEQALAWRMRRQRLDERVPRARMLDVVSDLCGLQAQVMSSTGLALWARVDGLQPADVGNALWKKRSLVKLWAMRGTLHLVPARDYPMWVGALRTYSHFRRPSWLEYFGLTAPQFQKLLDAIASSLDHDACSREELSARVRKATRSKAAAEAVIGSWGSMLKPASFAGDLCFAPSTGTKVNFVRPESWLGPFEALGSDDAMRAVARAWLATYGPASREDFVRWWGAMSGARVERLFKELGDDVTQVDLDGAKGWLLTEHLDAVRTVTMPDVVRLVPAFDQFVITAYRANPAILDPALKDRVYRTAGWLSPIVVVRGRMAGVWRHEKKGKKLLVTVEPFATFPAKVTKAVAAEAEGLASFVGGELELAWT